MEKGKIVMPGQKCMFMLALTFTYVICNEIFDFFQAVQFFIKVLNFLAKKKRIRTKVCLQNIDFFKIVMPGHIWWFFLKILLILL